MITDKSRLLPRGVTQMLDARQRLEAAIEERDRQRFQAMKQESRENNMRNLPLGTTPSAPNYAAGRKRPRRTLAELRAM